MLARLRLAPFHGSPPMTVIAILLAALAGFGTGALWYGVLGERWRAASGLDCDEAPRRDPLPFALAGAASLLTSVMLWHVLTGAGIAGFGAALVSGAGVGAFFVAPWIVLGHAFAGRPRDLWWIDGGHAVAACTVIGAVQGLFL